jgi:hypothetical protein
MREGFEGVKRQNKKYLIWSSKYLLDLSPRPIGVFGRVWFSGVQRGDKGGGRHGLAAVRDEDFRPDCVSMFPSKVRDLS